LLLSVADPGGNSIRRREPDRTGVDAFGSDATWLGLARMVRAGFAFGTGLAALALLVGEGAGGGGCVDALGGAGGGGGALRAAGFGADMGGRGGGSGAFGAAEAVLSGDAVAIFCGWTEAISGGGGATGAGRSVTDGGGGTARGVVAGGKRFFVGVRLAIFFFFDGRGRFTVFRTGLRLTCCLGAVGGIRASGLVPAWLLGLEMTGNLGPER